MMLCAEPSLFAPLAEWRAYLKRAESLGDEWTVSYARRTIALKEGHGERDASPSLLAPLAEWRAWLPVAERLGDAGAADLARRTIATKEQADGNDRGGSA
jgi:hypothetical protein